MSFTVLNDLVQVIYQSDLRFVISSTESPSYWTVEVGRVGAVNCQWWKSTMQRKKRDSLPGSEKIFDGIIEGHLFIGGWSGEPDAKIKLNINPSSDKPVSLPLEPYPEAESLWRAESILFDLAIRAQKHRSRLIPSSDDAGEAEEIEKLKTDLNKSQVSIANLKEKIKSMQTTLDKLIPPVNRSGPSINMKNRSLGNPLSRKRVLQTMEFESNSDDEKEDKEAAGSSSRAATESKQQRSPNKVVAPPRKKRAVSRMEFASEEE